MQGLDDKFFGSWLVLAGLSVLFGALFAIAAALIQLTTGGAFELGRQSIFMGCFATVAFFVVLARVRRQVDEELNE